MSYGVIYTPDQLNQINSLIPYSIGTQQGCSIQISNQSQYGMMILSGSTQIDYLHPYEYVIFPMVQNVIIQPDPATFANVTQPYSKVAYKLIKGNVSYQRGSIWQQNGSSNINNTTGNPGIIQQSTGEFDTAYYWNQSYTGTASQTFTIVSSSAGGFIKEFWETSASLPSTQYGFYGGISLNNGGNQILNGGITQWTGNGGFIVLPQHGTTGSGIANQGITLTLVVNSSTSSYVSSAGYVIIGQGNAPLVPKQIQ